MVEMRSTTKEGNEVDVSDMHGCKQNFPRCFNISSKHRTKPSHLISPSSAMPLSMVEPPPPNEASMASSSTSNPKPTIEASLSSVGEDLLQDILSRLPANSFAFASCVSRIWNRLCSHILRRPKFASALSHNRYIEIAVKEVLDKVLDKPIRPHFAIACVGQNFNMNTVHPILMKRLGSSIPIITSQSYGLIGRDAITEEFKEIKWVEDRDDHSLAYNGIVLMVGYVPGLKVTAIPLLQGRDELPPMKNVDKFVTDIREFSEYVSGSTSPVGIVMFADRCAEMRPVLDKLNYAMSEKTVIAGDESASFLYSVGVESLHHQFSWCNDLKQQRQLNIRHDAISLVFAKDRGHPHDAGEISFSLALATGVSPVGPSYKAASVRTIKGKEFECSTWLTARREGSLEALDGQRILIDIEYGIDDDVSLDDLYIGVTRRRKYSIGMEKTKLISSLAFHEVVGGDEEYLFVKGDGIKTGDSFRFFRPDPNIVMAERNAIFQELRDMKQQNGDKKEAFGGLMFVCYGRGESSFDDLNVESSAFLENFPGVPLAGAYCCGEIGRGGPISARQTHGQGVSNCFLHVYSSTYLIMLHSPKL